MSEILLKVNDLGLVREGQSLSAWAGLVHMNQSPAICQMHDKLLTKESLQYFNGLTVEKRKNEFICGQYILKMIAAKYLKTDDLTTFDLYKGAFNQPFIRSNYYDIPAVSLAHGHDYAVAVCCPYGHPMGVDIEKIDSAHYATLKTQLTEWELEEITTHYDDVTAGAIQFWSMKEAVSKATRCGLMVPFHLLEVDKVEYKQNGVVECRYRNFRQYRCYSAIANGYAISIVMPFKSSMKMEIAGLFR